MDAAHLSATIERVYAAGAGAERWRDAIESIYALVGATGGGIVRTNPDGQRRILSSALDPTAVAAYTDYYGRLDDIIAEVQSGPIGVPRAGDELIWPQSDSEFCTDWVSRNALGDGIFVRVDQTTALVCGRERHREPYATRERIAIVALVAPHLRRAIELHARSADADDGRLGLVAALDAVDRAMLIVTPDAEAEHLNAAARALVTEADGLAVDGSGRVVPAARVYAEFRAAVRRATALDGVRTGSTVLIPRPSGRRPLMATVAPLDSLGSVRRALVVVVAVDGADSRPLPDVLRRYFGLTAAEVSVAALLAAGHDLAEIADRLHIARSTARTHLQHLFDKTGTSRQAELAVMVARLTYTSPPRAASSV